MSETPADDGLDRLSSKELHDLAVRRAKRHLNLPFFWHLMQVLPAAEAVAGRTEDATSKPTCSSRSPTSTTSPTPARVRSPTSCGRYVDYLRRHGVKAP